MLPNYLVVGAMKSGTTSLAAQMGMHPEIFMASPKEVHFFSRDEVWQRGVEWYESLFAGAGAARAIGEASTTYTMYPTVTTAPARIAQTLKDVRFIYILRHPVQRVISQFMHLWYDGLADRELDEMIDTDPQLLSYSRYHEQVRQYMPYFPRDRWLILFFEEFTADAAAVHRQVNRFLGVSADFIPADTEAQNVTSEKVRPSGLIQTLRRVPGVQPLARALVPAGVRRRIATLGGRQRENVRVSDALYNRILKALRPDVDALGEFAGRDLSQVWNLEPR